MEPEKPATSGANSPRLVDALVQSMLRNAESLEALNRELQTILESPLQLELEQGPRGAIEALDVVRAYAQRSGHVLAKARILLGDIDVANRGVRAEWQVAHDRAVTKRMENIARFSAWSWEERSSMYRIDTLSIERQKVAAESILAKAKGVFDGIVDMNKALAEARWAVYGIVQGLVRVEDAGG